MLQRLLPIPADALQARAAIGVAFLPLHASWRRVREAVVVTLFSLIFALGLATTLAPPVLLGGAIFAGLSAREARHAEARQAQERALAFTPADGAHFIDHFRWLDVDRWVFSDGWDNGSFVANDWRADRLHVTPEGLSIVLSANPEPNASKPFSSGELQSRERFLYGYFETRMRVPRGDGLVVGFFTYTRPEGRSTWEEIDIEILGRDTRVMEVTQHLHGRSRQTPIDLGFDAADAFHTYGFEWTPDAVRFFVDNRLVHEIRGARVRDMTRAQRLYLQLWNSTELYRWVGHIDPAEAPWVLTVSCVAQARAYEGVSLCQS